MIALFISLGILVILAIWFFAIYNGLVGLRNKVKNAWAQIDVQLKRRYDLIPNLVETVKGYAKHEREALENVTKVRNMAHQVAASGPAARAKVEGELSALLSRLLVVAEAYPDLKANQNFLLLQQELASTENKISTSRQAYNDSVLAYNNKIQMIPSSIVAGMTGFKVSELFEVKMETERVAPKVSLT
jgi:LemA protein